MFHCTVRFYDEDSTIKTENCLIAADDYESAVEKILLYYGKDDVSAFSIEEYDDILAGAYLESVIKIFNEKVRI